MNMTLLSYHGDGTLHEPFVMLTILQRCIHDVLVFPGALEGRAGLGTRHSVSPSGEHTSGLGDKSNQKGDERSGKHSSSDRRQEQTVKGREGARDRDGRRRGLDMVMMLRKSSRTWLAVPVAESYGASLRSPCTAMVRRRNGSQVGRESTRPRIVTRQDKPIAHNMKPAPLLPKVPQGA